MPFGMPTRTAVEGEAFLRPFQIRGERRRRTGVAWHSQDRLDLGGQAVWPCRRRRGGFQPRWARKEQAWQIEPYRKRPIAYRIAGF
jgi:hypothetical protein